MTDTRDLTPERQRLANLYRVQWHRLMDIADELRLDRQAAIDLAIVVGELTKLGYTLTADETDWQPKGDE